jgi:5'-nucleotidase/UDP-sugar diphosphatase
MIRSLDLLRLFSVVLLLFIFRTHAAEIPKMGFSGLTRNFGSERAIIAQGQDVSGNQNSEAPPCQISDSSSCFGIEVLNKVNLTVLTFNDIYDLAPQNGYMGIAGLKTMLDTERMSCEHYITTVNGDFLSPSVFTSILGGKPIIDLFNLLEIDAVTFGNHEFDIGVNALLQRIQESKFVWLGTNVIDLRTGVPLANARSMMMFELGSIKFGLIGLTTPETAGLANAPRDILFAPVILSAQAAVHNLKKKGADVVIALTHLTLAEDIQLVRSVPEINLILGGHDHEAVAYFEGDTLIYKSGTDGKFLGRIDLAIEKQNVEGRVRTVIYPTHKLLPNHGYTIDPATYDLLKEFQETIDIRKSIKLGIITESFETQSVRQKESSFANLVTDSMQKAYGADIGIINSGAIRGAREYPSGYTISRGDLQRELPFNNIVVLVEISGQDLLEAIEFAKQNIEDRSGSFLHFSSGMRVVYDPKAPRQNRLREVTLHSKPIDKTATYKVAISDYLLKGGDGNHWFTRGKILIHPGTGYLLLDVVCDQIKRLEILHMIKEGRIVESETVDIHSVKVTNEKRIVLHEPEKL